MMKKTIIGLIVIVMLLATFSAAIGDEDFAAEIKEGKQLVDNKAGCDSLSDEQFEAVGEYIMETMHPGEAHESMHKMMGIEDGTEYHEQFHINMAKRMYCNNYSAMPMMGMMPGGMNSCGMMGANSGNMMQGGNMMDGVMQGMMGGYSLKSGFGSWNIIWSLFWIALVALAVWLIYNAIIGNKQQNPMNILNNRYAKGEITKKEFNDMKKDMVE